MWEVEPLAWFDFALSKHVLTTSNLVYMQKVFSAKASYKEVQDGGRKDIFVSSRQKRCSHAFADCRITFFQISFKINTRRAFCNLSDI